MSRGGLGQALTSHTLINLITLIIIINITDSSLSHHHYYDSDHHMLSDLGLSLSIEVTHTAPSTALLLLTDK